MSLHSYADQHPLRMFAYCPVCGSRHFEFNSDKSKLCRDCGFEYFLNPSAANVAFILDGSNRLLVATRDREPAKGTLDLPGGFADIGETAEEGVAREVKEETGLTVTSMRYLFSHPNTYLYSGFEVKTLDSFFLCEVSDADAARPHDDAAALQWIPLDALRPERFGLDSVRQGLIRFLHDKPWL